MVECTPENATTNAEHHNEFAEKLKARQNTLPRTTTVRHRLPLRKVNNVWKPLSSTSCAVLQEAMSQAMEESRATHPSLQRIEALAQKLTSNIRVPVGVYTGLKTNDEGKVDLLSLEALKKKNYDLEQLIQHRERNVEKLRQLK